MKHNLQEILAEQGRPNKMIPLTKEDFFKEMHVCYQCDKPAAYIFDDGRCKDCTRLTPEEIRGD